MEDGTTSESEHQRINSHGRVAMPLRWRNLSTGRQRAALQRINPNKRQITQTSFAYTAGRMPIMNSAIPPPHRPNTPISFRPQNCPTKPLSIRYCHYSSDPRRLTTPHQTTRYNPTIPSHTRQFSDLQTTTITAQTLSPYYFACAASYRAASTPTPLLMSIPVLPPNMACTTR